MSIFVFSRKVKLLSIQNKFYSCPVFFLSEMTTIDKLRHVMFLNRSTVLSPESSSNGWGYIFFKLVIFPAALGDWGTQREQQAEHPAAGCFND